MVQRLLSLPYFFRVFRGCGLHLEARCGRTPRRVNLRSSVAKTLRSFR